MSFSASSTDYPTRRTGTQSVERAISLLRELATHGTAGWGLWDLADRCGLDRGTTHRLLACLVRERLVHQRETDHRYFLGPLNFELAIGMVGYSELQKEARATVERLSMQLPRVVALAYLRSGDDCVCFARHGSSSYTRQGTGIRIGNRTPLLSLAGGAAILAALPKREAAAIIQRNKRALVHLGVAQLAGMQNLLRAHQETGIVLSAGVIWQGVNSIGVPFFSHQGHPIGSLAVSGAASDYPSQKIARVEPMLRSAANALSEAAARVLG